MNRSVQFIFTFRTGIKDSNDIYCDKKKSQLFLAFLVITFEVLFQSIVNINSVSSYCNNSTRKDTQRALYNNPAFLQRHQRHGHNKLMLVQINVSTGFLTYLISWIYSRSSVSQTSRRRQKIKAHFPNETPDTV